MKKFSKMGATLLVVLFCVLAVLTARTIRQLSVQKQVRIDAARAKGPENAPVKVIEFIDFECPACAQAADYIQKMVEKHPNAMRVQVKHFPLSIHRHAHTSARYVECAARQDKFWTYLNLIMAQQKNWRRLENADPAFLKIADDSGLDREKLASCLEDETVDEIIQNDKKEGKAMGVRSTPTAFVNGTMTVGERITEVLPRVLNEQEK